MPEPTRQYSKAPITEAVISIRVTPSGAGLEMIDEVCTAESVRYPNKLAIHEGIAQITHGVGVSVTQKVVGSQLSDHTQKQVVLLRPEEFTFSRLHRYEGWHIFQPEAQRLWKLYKRALAPIDVLRAAVRYINRIDLPAPIEDLKTYLTTLPHVAPSIAPSLSQFFFQVQVLQEDIGAMLILTEAIAEPPPGKVSALLDIDIFKDKDLPTEDDELWDLFEQFHKRKNAIFEACITEELRELIE